MSRPAAPPERRATLARIGGRIAERRRARGLHQADLASALGVARSTVGFWETGAVDPGSWRLERIARALGVRVDALFAGAERQAVTSSCDVPQNRRSGP